MQTNYYFPFTQILHTFSMLDHTPPFLMSDIGFVCDYIITLFWLTAG